MEQGALLLDVREPDEYQDVHAEDAQLMPLSSLEDQYQRLDKTRDIVAICRSGGRSARAAQFLLERGYNAVNLEGGTLAWEADDLPVERNVS